MIKTLKHLGICFVIVICLTGCATDKQYTTSTKPYTVSGKTYYPLGSAKGFTETGEASWYGPSFHGKKTASGDIYDQDKMTAAHKTLPFGTRVRVTNLNNNHTAIVIINDRGPFKSGRIIDVSRAAARRLDMIGTGTARVRIQSLSSGNTTTTNTKTVKKPVQVSASGKYYVQIGAFSTKENANTAINKLQNAGYPGHIKQKNDMFTVLTGPYATKSSAQSARDALRKNYSGAFVVE